MFIRRAVHCVYSSCCTSQADDHYLSTLSLTAACWPERSSVGSSQQRAGSGQWPKARASPCRLRLTGARSTIRRLTSLTHWKPLPRREVGGRRVDILLVVHNPLSSNLFSALCTTTSFLCMLSFVTNYACLKTSDWRRLTHAVSRRSSILFTATMPICHLFVLVSSVPLQLFGCKCLAFSSWNMSFQEMSVMLKLKPPQFICNFELNHSTSYL